MSKKDFDAYIQELKTQRDELKLQIHLAAAELKEEWQHIEEKRWPELEHKLRDLAGNIEEQAEDLGEAVEVVGEEIKATYSRIKARLKEID